MGTFKKVATGLLILAVMLTSSISFADGKKYKFKQLDPIIQKSLKKSLKTSNLPTAKELLEGGRWLTIEAKSCPTSCPEPGVGGMCYCDANPDGSCPDGLDETTIGGKDMCKTPPVEAEITGVDSDGNVMEPMKVQTGRRF